MLQVTAGRFTKAHITVDLAGYTDPPPIGTDTNQNYEPLYFF